jgi:hypothetical protein
MAMSMKRRLALGAAAVTSVGAAAILVAGFTFGLFSASAMPEAAAPSGGPRLATRHGLPRLWWPATSARWRGTPTPHPVPCAAGPRQCDGRQR